MSNLKIIAFCACSVISASAVSAAPNYIGQWSGYNDLLVTPAPHPGNTVDSPFRAENGRVWVGRAIGEHQTVHAPGAAAYGASVWEEDTIIFVRVNHVPVGISPWNRITASGLQDLERARNLWLKENGYVLGVRTFVNPRYAQSDEARATGASLPLPRATIRRHIIPAGPKKIQVMRPISGRPITRISKPDVVFHTPVTEIARADETTGD